MRDLVFYKFFYRTILFCLLLPAKAFAFVKLPAIFSNGMVLQQKSKVVVWGWADAGEEITVTASWASVSPVKIKTGATGKWELLVPTPAAGGPYAIQVKGKNAIELKEVFIGEVWVCSGQSNMVFSLKASENAKEEIQKADYPDIRFFNVSRQYGPEPFDDAPGSVWEKTSVQNAGSFSAVAYYFAKKIHQQLNVPVGIVYTAWGGTPAEAWTPKNIFQNDNFLSIYNKRWKDMFVTVGRDSTAYHLALAAWEKSRKSGDSTKQKRPEEPATLISYNRPWREPSVLFNGMINPVIPYTIKGVLWYQGESNVSYANEYFRLFSDMIKGWREEWKDPDLPFYFVQIAPFHYSKMEAAAQLREAQYAVAKTIPHTGIVVTIDLGEMNDQHFIRKKEVGDRLALIALSKDYGFKNLNDKGPEPQKIYIKNGEGVIEFGPSSIPLKAGSDTLKGFEIGYHSAQGEVIYKKAKARIENNKVIVWDEAIKEPIEIRYAWLLAGEANLFSGDGLPAFPFRMKPEGKLK
jgi:sialate O-acetylesterase